MQCVNTSLPQYKKLLEESKLPSLLLEMRVSKYMELNDGKFPELSDILNPLSVVKPQIKPGVDELFESNEELKNQVYEALGFKQTITQNLNSYYRGQIEEPVIDNNGNLIIYGREDELYKKAGLKSKGISMTDDLQSAIEYGNGQLEVAQNILEEEYGYDTLGYEFENKIDEIKNNGYWLIQIPKNIPNEIIKESGEVKVIGDKVVIPKGQYKIEQIVEDLETQLTPQQEQQAQILYSQYLDQIFPNSVIKDIVYHGTNNQDKQKFNKERAGYLDKGFLGKGFYSTYHKNYTKAFGTKTYALLLNIQNPLIQTTEKINDFLSKAQKAQELGYDSVFQNFSYDEDLTIADAEKIGAVEYNLPINKSFEQVVFEPEQIHILSSKADIEGFKNWVSNNQNKDVVQFDKEDLYKTSRDLSTEYLYDVNRELNLKPKKQNTFLNSGVKQTVFHISKNKIDIFKNEHIGINTKAPDTVLGHFFSEDYVTIATLREEKEDLLGTSILGHNIHEVSINLQKPYFYYGFIDGLPHDLKIIDKEKKPTKEDYIKVRKKLEELGCDGIIYVLSYEPDGEGSVSYNYGFVVFDSKNIKIEKIINDKEIVEKYRPDDFSKKTTITSQINKQSYNSNLFNENSYQKQDNDRAKDIVIKLLDKLSTQTNINYQIISRIKAVELLGTKYNGEGAFYYKGLVYILEDNLNSKSVIHEFAHPFMDAIYDNNKELFDKLYNQFITTNEGAKIKAFVDEEYSDYSQDNQKKEVLVRAVTDSALGLLQSQESKNIVGKFLFFLKQLFRKLFTVDTRTLSLNTTIEELGEMLINSNINIISKPLSQEDIVQFDRANQQLAQELESLGKDKLTESIDSISEVLTNTVLNLQRNSKYNEVKQSTKRNDRNEFQRANDILVNSKMSKDDVTRARGLAYTLSTIKGASTLILDRVTELNKDKSLSEQEKLSTFSYYGYLLSDWMNFITDFKKSLSDANVQGDAILRNVISNIEGNITSSLQGIGKNNGEAIISIMKDMLATTAANQLEKHTRTLDLLNAELKKGNSSAARRIKEEEANFKNKVLNDENLRKYLSGDKGDTNATSGLLEAYVSSPDPIVSSFAKFYELAMYNVESETRAIINPMDNELEVLYKKANIDRSNPAELGSLITFIDKIMVYNPETGEPMQGDVITLLNKFKDYRYDISMIEYNIKKAKTEGNKQDERRFKQDLKDLQAKWFHREFTDEYYKAQEIWNTPIGKIAKEKRDDIIKHINLLNDTLSEDPISREEQLEEIKLLWREFGQLSSLTDKKGVYKVDTEDNPALSIAKTIKEYQELSRKFYEDIEKTGLFSQRYNEEKQRLLDLKIEGEDFEKAINEWITKNTRTRYTQEFYDKRKQIGENLKRIYNLLPDSLKKGKDTGEIWDEILDITKGFRDKDGQPVGVDLTEQQLNRIKDLQLQLEMLKKTYTKLSGLTQLEQEELNYLFSLRKAKIQLTPEQVTRLDEIQYKKTNFSDAYGITEIDKNLFLQAIAELKELQSKVPTSYYVEVVNELLYNENVVYDENNIEATLSNPSLVKPLLEKYPDFKKWFLANHMTVEKLDYESTPKRMYTVYERLYAWNRIIPNEDKYYETYGTMDDGRIIKGIPTNEYFNRVVKNEPKRLAWLRKQTNLSKFDTKRLTELEEKELAGTLESYWTERKEGVNWFNNQWLPKDLPNSPYINHKYDKLRQSKPVHFEILEVFKKYHLRAQEGLYSSNKLGYDLPRFKLSRIEYLRSGKITDDANNVFKKTKQGIVDVFTKTDSDFTEGSGNYTDELRERMVYTDLYDNQIVRIPIKGLAKIPITQTSLNIGESISLYIQSAIENKKLTEIMPIYKALNSTVESNGVRDLKAISKNKWISKGVKTFIKSETNNRHRILSNMFERYFMGKEHKLELGHFGNKAANAAMGIAAAGTLALDLPGAIKNSFAANIQNFIESSGGQFINLTSFAKGKAKMTTRYIPSMIEDYNKIGNKSLETQMFEAWDFIQGKFKTDLGEQYGKSFVSDFLKFRWAYASREFGEIEAQGSFGLGVLEHTMIPKKEGDKTVLIPYSEAFELVNGVMTLKKGIDSKYAENGKFFLELKFKIHDLTRKLQGNYAKSTQPEFMRYTTGRLFGFMRKYLVDSVTNRFAVERLQIGQQTFKEGYYITSWNFLLDTIKDKKVNWNLLSNEDKANIIKTASEAAIIALFYVLLRSLGWDDNDKDRIQKLKDNSWFTNHLIYQLMTVKSETEQFVPVLGMGLDELFRLKNNLSLALGHLDTYYRILSNFVDYLKVGAGLIESDELYLQRDTGLWSKGDSKLAVDLARLMGIRGTTFDASIGIESFNKITSRVTR